MLLSSLSLRITMGANAARFASGVFGLAFVVVAADQLLTVHDSSRVPLAVMSALSAVVFLALRWASSGYDAAGKERMLLVLCVVPLVDIFVALALTRAIELTALLMLAVVGVGAITMRLRQAVTLVFSSYLIWLVLVTTLLHSDTGVVVHYGLQLLLAGVLAGVVFWVRSTSSRDLAGASRTLAAQLAALAAAREEREQALARYRSLFHDGPVGNSLTDEYGRFTEINPAVEVLLGRPAEQILGHSPLEFTHPEDREVNSAAEVRMDAAPDRVGRVEVRFVRPAGEIRWATVSLARVDGPAGAPWVLAHVQDITERKQMELDLVRSRDALAAIAEIASAMQRSEDPRPIAIAHLQRMAEARDVVIIERHDERTLVVTASAGSQDLLGLRISLEEQSITARAWTTGEPLFVADAASHPLANRGLLGASRATSLLWQPIGLPGAPDALMSLGWGERVSEVTEMEREAVRTIAAELGSALIAERIRLGLEQRTKLDPLTGLLNRRGWDEEIAALIEHSRQSGLPFVLAVADLDFFKHFNDEFGHLEGDILLSGFATGARGAVRDVDLVARWGGEEFAFALRNCDPNAAASVLQRVRAAVPGGQSCSIGYATYDPAETMTECMRRVDAALYRAKAAGRDRLEYSLNGRSSHEDRAQRPAVPR